MKIGVISLGCCKNLIDTQNAMSFLKSMGHSFVDDPNKADVIVVNTCGFINDAKQESIDTILSMAEYKNYNCKYLVVMGCLVQRYKEELIKELPEVDLFISISEYDHLQELFTKLIGIEKHCQREITLATKPYTAYLRIGDGCSNHCTYCAIPLIRGEFKTVPFKEVLDQAKQLEQIGVIELNLIAQDTTKYGIDLYNELKLKDLLVELNKMNFTWIRVLYMYPDEITDDLLETMAQCEKVTPYFDIPIQHINNELLKKMNRRGSKQDIIHIIEKIKNTFKDPVIRTTLIIGFPGESQQQFDELVQFIQDYPFDRLGAFKYSLEEDTVAYDFKDQIDEDVKEERWNKIMAIQQNISCRQSEKFIGKTIDVLIESKDALKNIYKGRSKYHAPDDIDGNVRFKCSDNIKEGAVVKVKITDVNGYDLIGEYISEE